MLAETALARCQIFGRHPYLRFMMTCNTNSSTSCVSLTPVKLTFQTGLEMLTDVLFMGNPIYEGMPKEEARIEVLRHVPQVSKIDGDMVKPTEREAANPEAV